jgi:hypothetical protein
MGSKTGSRARDVELAQLRATVVELADRLAQLETRPADGSRPPGISRAPGAASPPGTEQPPSPLRHLPRRGLLAGVAAVVAGAAAQWTTQPVAAAQTALLYETSTTAGSPINFPGSAVIINTPSQFPPGPGAHLLGVQSTVAGVRGVQGYSSTASGVVGISAQGVVPPGGYAAGVFGAADGTVGHGVQGVSGDVAGVPLPPTGFVGVGGYSGTGIGAVGTSTTNHGVFGRTGAPAGTVVNGMLAAGLAGRTNSTIALYGYADGPVNPNYAPIGAVGQCESGFGLWGLSSAGPGTTTRPGGGAVTAASGVLGTSANNVGVYAISSGSYALAADGNGPSTVAILARAQSGGRAGVFFGNVEINGHLTVTGGVNGPTAAAPATAQGDSQGTARSLQAVQSPEALVEGIGEGRLGGGQAEVRFDAALAALLPDDQYHVVLTEYDDHNGLYVTGRTRQGFTVRAKDSPTASGAFSYRVVARSRTARAAADTAPLHQPTIPVPQGVPTLPVGRESPTAAPAPKPDGR